MYEARVAAEASTLSSTPMGSGAIRQPEPSLNRTLPYGHCSNTTNKDKHKPAVFPLCLSVRLTLWLASH